MWDGECNLCSAGVGNSVTTPFFFQTRETQQVLRGLLAAVVANSRCAGLRSSPTPWMPLRCTASDTRFTSPHRKRGVRGQNAQVGDGIPHVNTRSSGVLETQKSTQAPRLVTSLPTACMP